MKKDQFITIQSSDELKAKYSMAKKDILIQIEMIKERVNGEETWAKIANLNKVLSELKKVNDLLRPF